MTALTFPLNTAIVEFSSPVGLVNFVKMKDARLSCPRILQIVLATLALIVTLGLAYISQEIKNIFSNQVSISKDAKKDIDFYITDLSDPKFYNNSTPGGRTTLGNTSTIFHGFPAQQKWTVRSFTLLREPFVIFRTGCTASSHGVDHRKTMQTRHDNFVSARNTVKALKLDLIAVPKTSCFSVKTTKGETVKILAQENMTPVLQAAPVSNQLVTQLTRFIAKTGYWYCEFDCPIREVNGQIKAVIANIEGFDLTKRQESLQRLLFTYSNGIFANAVPIRKAIVEEAEKNGFTLGFAPGTYIASLVF